MSERNYPDKDEVTFVQTATSGLGWQVSVVSAVQWIFFSFLSSVTSFSRKSGQAHRFILYITYIFCVLFEELSLSGWGNNSGSQLLANVRT